MLDLLQYVAAIGGCLFGVINDMSIKIPSKYQTIVDLLEARNISWGSYQEDMPHSGYRGDEEYPYVRKHKYVKVFFLKHDSTDVRCSPFVSYRSITKNENRLAKVKNFTMFDADLKAETLPQWIFITPSMRKLQPSTIFKNP